MALIEMTFAADTLKRWTEVTVILPVENAGMEETKKPELFPALYLLHGFGGNRMDWLTYSNIRLLAEANNLAVVMPSGENGFYTDVDEMETANGAFIMELIEYTRKIFSLSAEKKQTFIGGLSMGGFGALRIGMTYHSVFGKIFALSGAYILDDIAGKKKGYSDDIAGYGYYHRVFGSLDALDNSPNNPLVCAKKAVKANDVPKLFMACGTEDFVIEKNRNMKEALYGLGMELQYFEGSGGHDWSFWNTWLPKAVDWLMKE